MTSQTTKQGFLLLMSRKYSELFSSETEAEEKEAMNKLIALYDQHIELVILTHDLDKK